jgi:hypothetical protein
MLLLVRRNSGVLSAECKRTHSTATRSCTWTSSATTPRAGQHRHFLTQLFIRGQATHPHHPRPLIKIPISFFNHDKSSGLKVPPPPLPPIESTHPLQGGGLLTVIQKRVPVFCSSPTFPNAFRIDLAGRALGARITTSDLPLVDGMTVREGVDPILAIIKRTRKAVAAEAQAKKEAESKTGGADKEAKK